MKILVFAPTTGTGEGDRSISLPFVTRLARALNSLGHEVVLVGHWNSVVGQTESGFRRWRCSFAELIAIPFQGDMHSCHPFVSSFHIGLLETLFREEQPDIIHIFSPEFLRGSLGEALKKVAIPAVFTCTDFITVCARGNLIQGDDKVCNGGAESIKKCVRCNAKDRSPLSSLFKKALLAVPQRIWIEAARRLPVGRLRSLSRSAIRARTYVVEQYRGWNGLKQRINAVIAPAELTLALHRRHGWERASSHVIRWGIPQPDAAFLAATPRLTGPLVLGFSGRLARDKGLLELVGAVKRLLGSGLECVLKVFCNREDLAKTPYGRAVSIEVQNLGGAVLFCEYDGTSAQSFHGAMAELDYLVIPSRWFENIPLVALEALAVGTPIIAPRQSTLSEIIVDSTCGAVFEVDAEGRALNLEEIFRLKSAALSEHRARTRKSLYQMTPEMEAAQVLAVYREVQLCASKQC